MVEALVGLKRAQSGIDAHNAFNSNWIKFVGDGAAAGLYLDLAPTAQGQYGQIIFIDEQDEIAWIVADSVQQLIEGFYADLQQGCYQLDEDALEDMVLANKGITCIAFMGGDSDPESINRLAEFVKKKRSMGLKEWNNIKVAWYSGRDIQADEIDLKNFDYIKLGPYMEEYGPLTRRGTNQRFYWVCKAIHEYPDLKKEERYYTIDMTSEFWKDETKD